MEQSTITARLPRHSKLIQIITDTINDGAITAINIGNIKMKGVVVAMESGNEIMEVTFNIHNITT